LLMLFGGVYIFWGKGLSYTSIESWNDV
jgi:hypothetical protein